MRKLEILIIVLGLIMAGCFILLMAKVKPTAVDVLKGMFILELNGQGATVDAIALLGALVMWNDLYIYLLT